MPNLPELLTSCRSEPTSQQNTVEGSRFNHPPPTRSHPSPFPPCVVLFPFLMYVSCTSRKIVAQKWSTGVYKQIVNVFLDSTWGLFCRRRGNGSSGCLLVFDISRHGTIILSFAPNRHLRRVPWTLKPETRKRRTCTIPSGLVRPWKPAVLFPRRSCELSLWGSAGIFINFPMHNSVPWRFIYLCFRSIE